MGLELLAISWIRIVTASPEPVHGQPAVTTETRAPKVRPLLTMPVAAESVRTSYPRKQSRNVTTSRRRLHVVLGVLRRSGGRLNAKVAERPPGNL